MSSLVVPQRMQQQEWDAGRSGLHSMLPPTSGGLVVANEPLFVVLL